MSWYYMEGERRVGPVEESVIRARIESGQLAPTDLVIGPTHEDWITVSVLEDPTGATNTPRHISPTGELQCPKCESKQLHSGQRGYSFLRGGIFGSSKIVITCLKCGFKFLPGGDAY